MGWEKRGKKGRKYYYRYLQSPNGERVRHYLGRGEVAHKAAKADAEIRAKRLAERQAIEHEISKTSVACRLANECEQLSRCLFEATLLSLGFHRHNYGPWRKRSGFQGI
jgi:hypothetical protein